MNSLIPALFLTLCLSTSAAAEDEDTRIYFQLESGTAQFADSEIKGRDVTFDDGWSVSGRIGADQGPFAFEAEVGLHGAGYEPIGDGFGPALFLTAGINLIYKFLQRPGLDAFVGLGGGYLSDDPPINALQVSAHVESGLIMQLSEHVQLVPHVRTMAIFGASEDDVGRSETYSQYIATARLGLRF